MTMNGFSRHLDNSSSLPFTPSHLTQPRSLGKSFLDNSGEKRSILSVSKISDTLHINTSVDYLRRDERIHESNSVTTRNYIPTGTEAHKSYSEYFTQNRSPPFPTKHDFGIEDGVCHWNNCCPLNLKYSMGNERPLTSEWNSITSSPSIHTQALPDSPKISNIYKLLNDEDLNENSEKKHTTTSAHSRTKPIGSHSTHAPSTYHYPPYYHPYLKTADIHRNQMVSYITESPHQSYYYEPGYLSPSDMAYMQTYGYRPMGFLDVKNHTCKFPGCNMRFKRLEHLKRHFRVHTMERPFPCTHEGCGKAFSRSDNLSQHLKTHERRAQKLTQPNLF
ncbi:hypothetical protein K7432_008382 [Basidiobolus ranarum]|uniref:C2H2-type domain-containing protein n=1 Tax=Basidiobolus ranarum TaxID=34480 RepID=A0ABR2WS07_9FUNG